MMSRFCSVLGAAWRDEWQFLWHSTWDRALISWLTWLILLLFAAMFYSAVPRELPIVVVDHSHSSLSREIIRALDAAPALEVLAQPANLDEAWVWVRSNQANAVLYIPPELEKQVRQAQSVPLLAFYNATFTTAGGSALREIDAAIKHLSGSFLVKYSLTSTGVEKLKAAPLQAQVTVLYNPARNFEVFLLGLIFPALLHFILCVAVTSSFAREIRDSTVQQWYQRVGGALLPAVLGKMLPYIALFSLYGLAALMWVTYVRGDGMAGSLLRLWCGAVLMYAAYAAIGFMLASLVRNMSSALSGVGLYAGTSLAFCGATFPIDGAPWFARVWHHLLPFSTYLKLDAAERYMQALPSLSVGYLLILLAFVLVPLLVGLAVFKQTLNNPSWWGKR